MQRIVTFDGDKAAKRFEFCRIAVLGAGNGKGERTREVIRREARILTALDAVSESALQKWVEAGDDHLPGKDADPEARVLLAGEQKLSLSQEDHALLEGYLDTTPWLPRAARDAVDVQDWWSAAEKVEG